MTGENLIICPTNLNSRFQSENEIFPYLTEDPAGLTSRHETGIHFKGSNNTLECDLKIDKNYLFRSLINFWALKGILLTSYLLGEPKEVEMLFAFLFTRLHCKKCVISNVIHV